MTHRAFDEISDSRFAALLALMGAAFVALAFLTGCAGVPVPPPVQPPKPPGPVEIKHEPVCVPPGLVTGCWHQPPGSPWIFIPPSSAPGPVPVSQCPATCPPTARTMNARCVQMNADGKCITDSTPRCGDIGDGKAYCAAVTGNPGIVSCKANPEGSGLNACDTAFIGAACPIWEYSINGGATWKRCLPDGLGANSEFSCDHFDGWTDSSFQNYAGKCQHVETGMKAPIAGFEMVPHGRGWVRACSADSSVCSQPITGIDY